MARKPIVAAVLQAKGKDVNSELYCAAYGLEMQIDNAWNAELVLFAPGGHLKAVTKNTDVTGPDTKIVTAGVTDVPSPRTARPTWLGSTTRGTTGCSSPVRATPTPNP